MPTALNRTRLTTGRIDAFTCPPGKTQGFLWDSEVPGFAVRAAPAGRKTFVLERRLDGKTLRRTIGAVRDWTIEQARTEARRLAVLIDEGVNPSELEREQQAQREAQRQQQEAQAVTVGEAWASYCEARRPHWGELSRRDNARAMQAGGEPKKRGKGTTEPGPLAQFASMRLADLDSTSVQAWAEREGAERPTQARLALRLLRAFWNWCAQHPHYAAVLPASNPAGNKNAREALGKPQAKQDALLREQLPAWFAAVQAINNPAHAAYLQCLLLTGARPGELLALKWDDIDTQWQGLTIRDKDASKGGQNGHRIIPLTPYVHHLLASLPRRGLYVYSTSGDAPMSIPQRAHEKACTVAAVPGLTLHGLRRSFGSLSEWLELPAGVVAQMQGHKPSATAEKHYRVRPLDLLRVHHEKLEAWILEQAGVQFDASKEPGKLRAVH